MSRLRRRFDGGARAGNVPDSATCPHEALRPRWRDARAMAAASQPIGYVCHRCHAEFLPQQLRDGKVTGRG